MPYVQEITDFINQAIDSHQEYRESHKDAGDVYTHLPREGGWFYHNCDDHLKAFIAVNKVDTKGLDGETLAELVLDNFEMASKHTLSSVDHSVFTIDSYPVQEIELQLEINMIKQQTGLNVTPKRLEIISRSNREGWNVDKDHISTYSPSDVMWCAQISASDLQELINDYEG